MRNKRILILSDSHGEDLELRWLVEQAAKRGPIDEFIHCGDGAADFLRQENFLRTLAPDAVCYGVRGNCDFGPKDVPDRRVAELFGVRTFITHGHLFGVKNAFRPLAETAHDNGCALALFGHTHIPCMEMVGDVLLLNPGTATRGLCAAVDISPEGKLRPALWSF